MRPRSCCAKIRRMFAKFWPLSAVVILFSAVAAAEPIPAPSSPLPEWVVMNDAPKGLRVLLRGQTTDLGERNGWRCSGAIHTEDGEDQASVWCFDAKTRVTAMGMQKLGVPLVDGMRANLIVSAADGSAVVRALALGVRSKP